MLGLCALTPTLAKGTTGKTKVNSVAEDKLTATNTYVYKISAAATAVAYNETCTTGWTAATLGTTEISTTAGQIITLVEIDSNSKAKAVGTVTVVDDIG
ncbi:MAG: hypothetical protein Q4F95_07460 [Oscillospiraceae bacterium]|nr:hypothetical protein [Oscillospiraceae bacterium]